MDTKVTKENLQEFATKLHAKNKTLFASKELENTVDGLADDVAIIKAAVGSPLVANTVAEMTDTDKVYVYVGSEAGYTEGNWYYYDGNDWTSGGVYNSTAFETDDTLSIAGMAADAKITGEIRDNINPLTIYSGRPANNAKLFTVDALHGATKFYYDFTVPAAKASYIELMDSSGTRISYIGKGSSSSGDLSYEGSIDVPEGFSYAKFATTASAYGETIINAISIYMTSEYIDEICKTTNEAFNSISDNNQFYVSSLISSSSTGTDVQVAYAFGVRFIYLPKGTKLFAKVKNGFSLQLLKFDKYGEYLSFFIANGDRELSYIADVDCFVNFNVIADDPSITLNNDYIEKSGFVLYKNYIPNFKKDSGQIINRVYVPAKQHGNDKVIRIPSVKIMPNRKILCMYEVRDSLSDFSTSFLGYSIINNGSIESHGAVAQKESGEVRQFNPQIYTLPNGNIFIMWTSNDANDVCRIHYCQSSDYGNTYGEVGTLANTIDGSKNILTAPANGVFVENDLLIPVYETNGVYDEDYCHSGLMLLNLSNMSHSEKFVSTARTNECNVFIDGENALLTARQETITPAPYRHIYKISKNLSDNFVELNNFYIISKYRTICQESYLKTDNCLYMCMANANRNGIKLYASDDLSRTYTELVQLIDTICGGYSCIDITNNSIVVATEGADAKNTTGEYVFVDSVVLGNTV